MSTRFSLALGGAALMMLTAACNPPGSQRAAATDSAPAAKSFVAPGEKDEFYLFYSGGHSGQVYVAGLPSMRHISTIPVFAPYPATGYGFDEETKGMLGRFTWGDVHHPGLSQSGGKYDGRWLFVNDNANNRIARIDLRDFKTKQILRRPGGLQDRVQRHGQRHPRRSENGRDVGRLADPDAAVQLGPRVDRQGPELGLGLLDLVQLRDGARDARGDVDAG
jgi:nitrous-oxide reductase